MSESLSSLAGTVSRQREVDAPSCAVLVMSCDAYRDLWRPFFTLFWRYWADCQFPIYLGANRAEHKDGRVTTICAGDGEWSRRLRFCLERMQEEYILLLLEDYFFVRPISTAAIVDALKLLHSVAGAVLRLYPFPGPDMEVSRHRNFGRIHPLAPYRVSTQAAIWDRRELLRLLHDDETIWDFEWKGTKRSRSQPEKFYSCYEALLPYRQVVERGQWFWSAARKYGKEDIGCDFSARPVMSRTRAIFKVLNARRRNLVDAAMKLRLRSGI